MEERTENRNASQSWMGTELQPSYQPSGDERTLAILAHVLSLFFWIFPALIIYLLKKDESAYVADHAKEALNFQITLGLMAIVLIVTIVGWLFLWLLWPFELIFCVVAAIKASDLRLYRYPFTLRLIK